MVAPEIFPGRHQIYQQSSPRRPAAPPPRRPAALAAGTYLVRSLITKRLVWPLRVVEREVLRQPYGQIALGGVTLQIHILVLDVAQ